MSSKLLGFIQTSSICIVFFNLFSVRLQLPVGMIEIGKDLKLTCTSSIEISANKSRQWRGGVRNKLLCYDGITIDPHKYREEIKTRSAYELTVKEISESDLQCPYACRIGFNIDQKFLNVTEQNFLRKLTVYIKTLQFCFKHEIFLLF